MDIKDVERLVEFYEKRVYTEFDKYFNYLVLEDFYEGGFEDRIEDEWFYDEYFEKYEEDIINLLLEIGDEEEEYYDFQLRLIKLKRIIDNKLIKIGKSPKDIKPKRQSRLNHFILGTDINTSIAETLYKELHKRHFINCSNDRFYNLFDRKKEIQKIQWIGTELQLTSLVSELLKKRILHPDVEKRKFIIIKNNFLNKKGNEFKVKQLSSVFHDKVKGLPNDDEINDVLKEIST